MRLVPINTETVISELGIRQYDKEKNTSWRKKALKILLFFKNTCWEDCNLLRWANYPIEYGRELDWGTHYNERLQFGNCFESTQHGSLLSSWKTIFKTFPAKQSGIAILFVKCDVHIDSVSPPLPIHQLIKETWSS